MLSSLVGGGPVLTASLSPFLLALQLCSALATPCLHDDARPDLPQLHNKHVPLGLDCEIGGHYYDNLMDAETEISLLVQGHVAAKHRAGNETITHSCSLNHLRVSASVCLLFHPTHHKQ